MVSNASATISPEVEKLQSAARDFNRPPKNKRRTILRWLAIAGAALLLVAFGVFDIWSSKNNLTVTTRLAVPLFKEKGYSFFTYVPEPRVSAFLNLNANLHSGAKLFAGKECLRPASLQEVREQGHGTFFQMGTFLWLSLPDNGDANQPNAELSVRSPLKLKPWVRYTSYSLLAAILFGLLLRPFFARSVTSLQTRFPGMTRRVAEVSLPARRFLKSERWTLVAIASLLAVRIFTLPPVFNFLDTFTMLRAPLSIVGHIPPLYLLLIAGLKAKFGLGHVFLDVLLAVQYSFFAAALLYLSTAFRTTKEKLFAVGVVAANFYVSLIVGGIMTESLALSEQIFLLGATLRIAREKDIRKIHWAILAISCALCVLTRHTFVLFAAAPILYCFLNLICRQKDHKQAFLRFGLTTALCATGTLAGLQLSSLAYKHFNPAESMPAGRFGVQVMARGWQEIKEEDRSPTYDNLASKTNDPLVKATFRAVLALPNSSQPVYDYATIYGNIQQVAKNEYGEQQYKRALDPAELEKATAAATKVFIMNPDRYYLQKVRTFLLQYTQLGEILTAPNPVYNFAVIKSRDSIDIQGVGWNLPEVHWGYLNRCVLDHSAISDMWSHLCEDTRRITDRVFSPENKNLLRDCINGKVFWLLDFVNPATNLILLVVGLSVGPLIGRLSLAGTMAGTAILISALGFDLLHALSTQDTLSRYLAPGSFQLALGVLVVYAEVIFGIRAAGPAGSICEAEKV